MPYGYYQLVRFISMIGFGILAFEAHRKERQLEMVTYAMLALLFQPFVKVALGRELWNIVDVIVAIGLLISMIVKSTNKNLKHKEKEQNRLDRELDKNK